jgi:hypothetical protein
MKRKIFALEDKTLINIYENTFNQKSTFCFISQILYRVLLLIYSIFYNFTNFRRELFRNLYFESSMADKIDAFVYQVFVMQ